MPGKRSRNEVSYYPEIQTFIEAQLKSNFRAKRHKELSVFWGIEYVLHAMDENPSDIRNIRAYLLTALYNASLTMDNYYAALVNHDLYGQPKVDKKQGL